MKKILSLLILLTLTALPCLAQEQPDLEVIFFDAGKADAILIRTGDAVMLMDTGVNKFGDELVKRLTELGVEKIDVLMITHFDKDHVGGADAVIDSFPIGAVYQPDYYKESKQMDQYLEAMDRSSITPTMLSENMTFSLGEAQLSVDVANRSDYGEDEENDFSLVTSLVFGETRFLFAGDAEEPRIYELLDEGNLEHDVLKVPHHGKNHDNNALFFQAVNARYAVITSEDDEMEKHEAVYLLERSGAQVLLTRLGEIRMVSDGQTLTVSQETR